MFIHVRQLAQRITQIRSPKLGDSVELVGRYMGFLIFRGQLHDLGGLKG